MEDLKIFEEVSLKCDEKGTTPYRGGHNLVLGHVVNRIEVDPDTTRLARIALDRMLAVR